MTKTVKELHEMLKKACPFRFFGDKKYLFPPLSDVKDVLKSSWIDKYGYLNEIFDCEDYSVMLLATIRREQYRLKWKYPWAAGIVWGFFNDIDEYHSRNFVLADDSKLYLMEPQDDEIRYYESGDTLHAMFM